MTKHNYPAHIVEAVAKAMMDNFGAVPWERSTERERSNGRTKADIALSALWVAMEGADDG